MTNPAYYHRYANDYPEPKTLVVCKSSVSTQQSIVPRAFERKTRANEGNILGNSLLTDLFDH